MTKVTEWFPADVTPVRAGVYQTRTDYEKWLDDKDEWFQYWDGITWRATGTTVDRAYGNAPFSGGDFVSVEWRGLTERAA
jgi:hypothetical protein